jgi:hypothetical protein
MTFRHLATSYCVWVWFQWSRLSAFFFTTCVVAALTVALIQTTRQYNLLYNRVHSSPPSRESGSGPQLDVAEARKQAEVVRLLERILARLPEAQEPPVSTAGPLSSNH